MFTDVEMAKWLVAERAHRIDELNATVLDRDDLLDGLRSQVVDAAIDRVLDASGIKREHTADLLDAVDRTKLLRSDGTVDVERVQSVIGTLASSPAREHRPPPRTADRALNRGQGRYLERES